MSYKIEMTFRQLFLLFLKDSTVNYEVTVPGFWANHNKFLRDIHELARAQFMEFADINSENLGLLCTYFKNPERCGYFLNAHNMVYAVSLMEQFPGKDTVYGIEFSDEEFKCFSGAISAMFVEDLIDWSTREMNIHWRSLLQHFVLKGYK